MLGETLNEHPDLEIYMSADHGMNFKKICYDLNKIIPRKGCEILNRRLSVVREQDR